MNILHSSSSANRLCYIIIASIFAIFFPSIRTEAFPLDSYACTSVLSEGKWVRISVTETGIHVLSTADLRRFGFNDPTAVKIYGYGGNRLSDLLSPDEYIDDLIPVASELTSKGLVFYARGAESWNESTTDRFTYHTLNPYSTLGYYFLTDNPSLPSVNLQREGEARRDATASTVFEDRMFHESDILSPGESGHLLVGEEFKSMRKRTFQFRLTDPAAGGYVTARVNFVGNAPEISYLEVTLNGESIKKSISSTSKTNYGTLATILTPRYNNPADGRVALAIEYSGGGTVRNAWLDCIDLNYTRNIALSSGVLHFTVNNTAVTLANASPTTRVWDVTDPRNTLVMNTLNGEGNTLSWVNPFAGQRNYAAWDETATLPAPQFVEVVANQNIHGEEVPDMIVVTVADWRQQAERLAELHRNGSDSLRVLVVDEQAVYNEFSSGTPDVNAFRRMFKMFYDRGNASPDASHHLQYALMFGRATHDNRQLTSGMRALKEKNLPCWQTEESLRESTSYMTDDFLSFLEDNSGLRVDRETLSISVGRVPAGNAAEARDFVDKLTGYLTKNSSRSGAWKNRVILMADDGDNGIHLTQSESMYANLMSSSSGDRMVYSKIYVDAFEEVGGEALGARKRLHRELQDGAILWTYIGHGDKRMLTTEKLITFNDATDLTLRNLPFLYAATCLYLKWDGVEKSAGELMFHNRRGGVIGAICPTREVYISENEYMSNSFGRHAFERDSHGRIPTIGDMMKNAKNDLRDKNGLPIQSNDNKLRYVLMGDPALRLVLPGHEVRLDSINGVAINGDDQPTVMARQKARFSGSLIDPVSGSQLSDFNGQLTISLYDAEETVTTEGRPSDNTDGKVLNFEQQGAILYTGCDTIRNGRFAITVAMPSEVADNFRPAALSLYARADDGREAVGCDRRFFVYGYDDTAEADTIPPVIEYAVLNHTSFRPGDHVNPEPMFLAKVSDNVGINLSTAGIGHQMLLKIDGSDSYNDVSSYYIPSTDGSASGSIAFPLSSLSEGSHSLMFRVWDTAGNATTSSFDFMVRNDLAPTLFDVYTDANPASIEANFYLSHNRPDAEITVTVEVFNIAGKLEWSSTVTDRSDMFLSAPLTWNLCNMAGHRVPRGIYLYRATVTCDDQTSSSIARRIAVTAQ